jgi:hypothetical protein
LNNELVLLVRVLWRVKNNNQDQAAWEVSMFLPKVYRWMASKCMNIIWLVTSLVFSTELNFLAFGKGIANKLHQVRGEFHQVKVSFGVPSNLVLIAFPHLDSTNPHV